MTKYYGYLYETIIPTSDGKKHYYGKKEYDHRCKRYTGIYKNYWGSGIIIKDWFLAHTNNNYTSRNCPESIALKLGVKRIIHGFYKTREELSYAEKELISKHLNKRYCINLANGGTGGNTGNYICTEKTRFKKRMNSLGMCIWNNGVVNKRSRECPGPEWKRGMLMSIEKRESYSIRMKQRMKILKNRPSKEQCIKNIEKAIQSNRKAVKCIELNLIFKSLNDAQKYFNLTYNKISIACKDKNKTWHGYHWEYI